MKRKNDLSKPFTREDVAPFKKKQRKSTENNQIVNLCGNSKPLNYDKITKKVITMLDKHEFDDLERYLADVPYSIKDDIFCHNFYYAMEAIFCHKSELSKFKFVLKHVSSDAISSLFHQEDYGIFKKFLSLEICKEELGLDTEVARKHRVDKFKFIIKSIETDITTNIIEQENIGSRIKEDFEKAHISGNKHTVYKPTVY